MLHFPNCKINLGLHVQGKRPDGYHELESVLYPVPLHDALEIVAADELSFLSYGLQIPGEESNNIVLKAYHLLQRDFPAMGAVAIALLKKIPSGAGLGGGSSDGAEMLKMLNMLFKLKLSDEALSAYALELGSDCPFFIKNIPARACGRGEILSPVALDLSQYRFVIVKPAIHISTAWAFSQIAAQPAAQALPDIVQQPIESWKDQLRNDFEAPIFKKYPEIGTIKRRLYEAGAVYSSMSGSGSAVYGIFEKNTQSLNFKSQMPNAEVFIC